MAARRRGPQAARRSARVLLAAIVFTISLAGSGVATMIWLNARPTQVVVAPDPSPTPVGGDLPPHIPPPGAGVTSGDIAELRGRIGAIEAARPGQRLDTLENKVDRLPSDTGAGTKVLLGLFGLWLLLAIALGVIAAMLFRRFDEIEAQVEAPAPVPAPAPLPPPTPPARPDPTIARLERRIAELEAERSALPSPTPAPIPAPSPAPVGEPPATLDSVADALRVLINARGALETFNEAVTAQPRAFAIVHDDLSPFDPSAAMDDELVLFGSDDRLAVLPAPLRARDLQRTPGVRSALPESYAHFFAIEPGEGFRVVSPAFVSHDGGQLRLIARGALIAG